MTINSNKQRTGMVRWITYILACLGVLILILGLIFPKEIKVETATISTGQPQQVYNIASNILNTEKWWPSLASRKDLTYTYSDMKFTKGATVNFTSKDANGYIRIDKLDSTKSIAYTSSLDGKERNIGVELSKSDDGTNLIWRSTAKLSYPQNAFGPFIKYRWKKELRQSSALLQKELDLRMKDTSYYGYKVKEATQNAKHFQTIRSSISHDKFSLSYSQNIAAIYQKLSAEGITPQGHPCAIIYGYDEQTGHLDIGAAVGVLAPVNVKDLTLVSFPIHNTAYVPYFGDNIKNEAAHYALNDYISDRGFIANYPAIEEYVTDPLKEKDPSKWQTNIYYYFTDRK